MYMEEAKILICKEEKTKYDNVIKQRKIMINFDDVIKENKRIYNPNWPLITDNPCRILSVSGSGSGKPIHYLL